MALFDRESQWVTMIIIAQNVDIINFYKIFAIHHVFYKLTVNQLVVGSIPTAEAKIKNKINNLHHFHKHSDV